MTATTRQHKKEKPRNTDNSKRLNVVGNYCLQDSIFKSVNY